MHFISHSPHQRKVTFPLALFTSWLTGRGEGRGGEFGFRFVEKEWEAREGVEKGLQQRIGDEGRR